MAEDIARFQFMKNMEAGQTFGNQMEIRPLTDEFFQKEVVLRFSNSWRGHRHAIFAELEPSSTLEEHLSKYPHITHYSSIRTEGSGPWELMEIGPRTQFILAPGTQKYAHRVSSFDSPLAIEWGNTADSDIYGLSGGRSKEKWAFTVAAYNGADTFGHSSKKAAEQLRTEMLEMVKRGEIEFVSSLMEMVPGAKHWVVHVRLKNGQMKSYGFGSQVEAQKFHRVMMDKVEGVELASFPTEAELKE